MTVYDILLAFASVIVRLLVTHQSLLSIPWKLYRMLSVRPIIKISVEQR